MKQTKHWLLTVVLLLCSAAQMSGEIILTQADGLLNERIDHNDATTQYHYKSPVLTLGEATNTFVFTMLDGYSETLEWASPYDHRGFPFMCIAEFTLYDGEGNKIALDASNFSTNAQEPTEGNIAYICDGKQYTFFHSTWSGAANANHYIAITLPEDIELEEFQFEYYTRKAEWHSLHGIPSKLSVSSNIAEGQCGENLSWKLKVNGELSIWGKGEMENYGWRLPWPGYRDDIKKVTLDNGVTSIVDYAFGDCINLQSVELPNSLTSIASGAFFNCANLSSIAIPASVSHIGEAVFGECPKLTNLAVAEGNPYYYSTNNCDAIIETATNTLLRGTDTTVIPNNIQGIGDYAFSGCDKLASITLPASVDNIGSGAFQNCTNLSFVGLPAGLSEIKDCTFNGCASLSSIDLPEGLQSIGYAAFNGCISLTAINMPESMLSIGNSAFYGCTSLTAINMPESMWSIGILAFYGCVRLKTLNIPQSVWYIGGDAFDQTAWYEKQSNGMIYINNVLYCYKGTAVVSSITVKDGTVGIAGGAFSNQTKIRTVKLPESLEYIGNAAFYRCTSLNKIILPKNVAAIEQQAFEGCNGLKSITCYAEIPPSIHESGAFANVSTQIPVYVPESSVSLYREHELWGRFTNIQAITEETGVENIQFVGNDAHADAVYDVNGRRIDNTQNLKKGIYIHNGRKVFVK